MFWGWISSALEVAMRISTTLGAVLCLVCAQGTAAQLMSPATSAAMNGAIQAADREATLWLGLIRDDRARDAWNRTAPHFKQRINRETFERIWSPHSGRLQPVVSRRNTAVRYIAAAPPDQPEMVVFDTRVEFRGGTLGGETITLGLAEGVWRVWEYAVSPGSTPRSR